MAKITKRSVDSAKAGEKEFFLWDDELAGFGLRVYPSGRKIYLVQFRTNGRLRRVNIGPHGPFTAESARKRALEIIARAKGGVDVAQERDELKRTPTMAQFGERFLREYVAVRCKATTQTEYRRSIELFINPRIGSRKITDIGHADIAELHYDLRQVPYQANRTLGVLSRMFNLADLWEIRTDGVNPCRKVRKYKEEKRERFLSEEEFGRLGQVLRDAEQDGSESPAMIAAVRLLVLTGCRLSEIQKLRWEHVDLPRSCLRLPDSKTGAKVVLLGRAAAEVLVGIERLDDNPHVIVGTIPGQYLTDMQKPWRRIRKRAGLDDVRIHDLRHSFASQALAGGENLPMIGKMLGHSQVQTTARYAHLAEDPIRLATDRVAESIASAMGRSA
ncbi:MAG: tyrosine-type recombinase/integrase [Rhizobiales bacterium]|nr:tyrosine-type recombinase/integrase [Hyphomicrobiales bacterium]